MFSKCQKSYFSIFLACLLSRLIFKWITGNEAFEMFGDAIRYDILSQNIIEGNHNMDLIAFVVSPLYPYTMAFAKILFPIQWEQLMILYQFILVSISAIYIYKISKLLFKSHTTALLAASAYILYPLTLWYNYTLSQETSFQSYFIIFSYYFLDFIIHKKNKSLYLSSLFLCLSFLTKSHITLLLPFLVFLVYRFTNIRYTLAFLGLSMLMFLPQGILNKTIYNSWGISNFASGSLFLVGHSEETYPCLTRKIYEYPQIIEDGCNLNLIFHAPYDFGKYGQVNQLHLPQRNSIRYKMAFSWIFNNPLKFLELKLNGIYRFIVPGLDYRVYSDFKFWVSLILGLLIYIPAYLQLYKCIKSKSTHSYYSLSVMITIGLIFIIFYPQNRFRVITLEPLLICYASEYLCSKINVLKNIIP